MSIFAVLALGYSLIASATVPCENGLDYDASPAAYIHPHNGTEVHKVSSWEQLEHLIPKGRDVVGRIVKVAPGEFWSNISTDVERKFVFVMNREGIDQSFSSGQQTLLETLGYTRDYVATLRAKGVHFYAVFFKPNTSTVRADWDGIEHVIGQNFPPNVLVAYRNNLADLKSATFQQIDKTGPAPMAKIYEDGPSTNTFVKASTLTANSKLWDVRAFLFNELRLTDLFSGDGFTTKEDGTRGIPEYLTANLKMSDIDGLVAVDINDILASKL